MKTEEYFRNKLKNHKVDWDKEELLSDLKQELNHNKRSFNWLWFLITPILLLVMIWGWNSQLQDSEINLAPTPIESSTVLNGQKDFQDRQNVENEIENDPYSSTLNRHLDPIEYESNSSNATAEQQKKMPNQEESKRKSKSISFPATSAITANLKARNPNLTEQATISPLLTSKKSSEPVEGYSMEQSSRGAAKGAHIMNNEPIINFQPSDFIPRIKLNEIELFDLQWPLPIPVPVNMFQAEEERSSINPFYISAYQDIGLAQRMRNYNTSNTTFVNRLEANEETEKSLFTFTSNINLGYQHKSGLQVQSGIAYTEIKEVLNYTEETSETIRVPTEEVLYFIVDKMDTLYVKDTSNVLRTTKRTVKHYNKHKYFSIPLQVGYQWELKKAKLISSFGLSYAFSYGFNGKTNQIIEGEGNEIAFASPVYSIALKNRIGVQLGIEMNYPILTHHDFFVRASLRRSPSMTSYIIEQKYTSLSLGAGLKFFLSGKS